MHAYNSICTIEIIHFKRANVDKETQVFLGNSSLPLLLNFCSMSSGSYKLLYLFCTVLILKIIKQFLSLLVDIANILLVNHVNLCVDFFCLILCLSYVSVVTQSVFNFFESEAWMESKGYCFEYSNLMAKLFEQSFWLLSWRDKSCLPQERQCVRG